MRFDSTDSTVVTLSTGRTVSLPLDCRARLGGAVVGARWSRLRAMLPEGVTPLRTGITRGAVALVGVDYRAVGEFEPYDEFAVVVPVAPVTVAGVGVPRPAFGVPGLGVGGYVYDLPVTTDASRALGEEVWGFPKSVTGVDVEATPTSFEVSVGGGSTPAVSLAVTLDEGTAARRIRTRQHAYSFLDGRLVRSPVDLDCECRVELGGGGVRLALGRGRYADALRDLGLTGRVYASFVASHAEAAVGGPADVGPA